MPVTSATRGRSHQSARTVLALTTRAMIYNARAHGYTPLVAWAIDPFPIDLSEEPGCMMQPDEHFWRQCGPGARAIATELLTLVPAGERERLRWTVRGQRFRRGEFPAGTPKVWHTDYAPMYSEIEERQSVHTYALITAGPLTHFLLDELVELPAEPSVALPNLCAALPKISVGAWTMVRFNGTEIHTATCAERAGDRLFVRATFTPFR